MLQFTVSSMAPAFRWLNGQTVTFLGINEPTDDQGEAWGVPMSGCMPKGDGLSACVTIRCMLPVGTVFDFHPEELH